MKVSIITVTYNSADTLQSCIDSVANQSYKNIEHIVIDGNSKDNTLEIIQKNTSVLRYISEPDNGLYDAMNKGLKLVSGDVIGILNSDDIYENNDVISDVVNALGSYEALYTDLCYVDSHDINLVGRYWKSGEYNRKSFKYGWMPPHPTLFLRREVYEKYGDFNLELKSSADYELMLRFLYKEGVEAVYLPKITVKMREG